MARFYDPHPNDGTGPGVLMPKEAKEFIDQLDGEDLTVAFAVDELRRTCSIIGVDADVKDCGDYIQLTTFPHGRDSYPQHHWRAIRYTRYEMPDAEVHPLPPGVQRGIERGLEFGRDAQESDISGKCET